MSKTYAIRGVHQIISRIWHDKREISCADVSSGEDSRPEEPQLQSKPMTLQKQN